MPIRDIALSVFLAGTLPYVFRYAFIGILLWTWIGVMNPHKLAFGFMYDAPVAIVIGLITLSSLFTTRDRVKLQLAPPLVFAGLFVLWTCVTTIFAFFPEESFLQLQKVLKIQIMLFVTAAVLYKWEHIRLFIWVNVLSLGFYGVKGGIYTITTAGGGRVWGPPGGFIAGNNELALALIMAIPFMHYLRLTTPYIWVKRGLLVMMGLTAISALGSQSRGALLAISAMGLVLWWRSPNKLISAVIVTTLALSIWNFMPQSWHDRMDTIQSYEEDGSAMGRIFAWQTAANLAKDRVFGGGYDMYYQSVFSIYAPRVLNSRFDSTVARAAHSIYFQVLGEHGFIGLFLFVMVWVSAWRLAARLRRGTRDNPDEQWLYYFGSMAQVCLVGWVSGGAFLSLAYWDFPYSIAVALVVAQRWRNEHKEMPEVNPPVPPQDLSKLNFRQRVVWWIRSA
ncbi:MAG: putative O-glycosylation ligase, exosortase A system-associated [Gammaproteobacteria bacterium]|nr:putative O-glycosylation ligase, exosortase A system-associated [Gammaproteobacteria bacterium]